MIPVCRSIYCARAALFCCLAARNRSAELGSSCKRLQVAELLQIGNPTVADRFRDQLGKRRVGLQQPAPRRDAVGLVVELCRPQFGEVAQHLLLEEPGVQLGHTVDRARAHIGQVRHADMLLVALLDNAHPLHPVDVERIPGSDLPHEAGVDLEDDLQVPGQQPAQHVDRPFFQGLGQDGVVGVAR